MRECTDKQGSRINLALPPSLYLWISVVDTYVIKLCPAAQNVKFAVEIKIKTMLKKMVQFVQLEKYFYVACFKTVD